MDAQFIYEVIKKFLEFLTGLKIIESCKEPENFANFRKTFETSRKHTKNIFCKASLVFKTDF